MDLKGVGEGLRDEVLSYDGTLARGLISEVSINSEVWRGYKRARGEIDYLGCCS